MLEATKLKAGNYFNPLSANLTKWSNTLKHQRTNCLVVFDHFVGLALNRLIAVKSTM